MLKSKRLLNLWNYDKAWFLSLRVEELQSIKKVDGFVSRETGFFRLCVFTVGW